MDNNDAKTDFNHIKDQLEKQSNAFELSQLEQLEELDDIFTKYDIDSIELEYLNNIFYIKRLKLLENLRDLMIKISQDRQEHSSIMKEIMKYWAKITGTAEDYIISELLLCDLLDNGYISKADYEIYDVAKPVNRWL